MLKTSELERLIIIQQSEKTLEEQNHSMVDWWLRLCNTTPAEHSLINQPCSYNSTLSVHTWDELQAMVRSKLPYQGGLCIDNWEMNLDGYHLYLDKNATELIYKICEKEIDDDTLIITSVVEHPAVKGAIESLNRTNVDHVILNYYNGINELNISQVKEACDKKNYKKAFVMIIGTQVTTGEVTPQKFFTKLKKYLTEKGIETVMAIDDCQGMYLVPRNYNIFDYVIYTAHTLVREHHMGMLWSKKELDFGLQKEGWLTQYYNKLRVMLKFRNAFNNFSYAMREEFRELYRPYITAVTDSVPFIFSIKVDCQPSAVFNKYTSDTWLKEYEIKLESDNDKWFYIKMRAAQYIATPEKLLKAIPLVKMLLNNVIDYKESINDYNC